jgi:hypothetical protein
MAEYVRDRMTITASQEKSAAGNQEFQRTAKIETVANGIINAIINGVLAWLMLGGGGSLTPGGDNSYVADTAATAFVLPFILSLIVISLNRRKLRIGKMPPVELSPEKLLHARLARFPESIWAQAFLFGVIATLVTTPLVVGLLWMAGLPEIPPATYAIFKGAWTGILAAALVRPAMLVALRAPA